MFIHCPKLFNQFLRGIFSWQPSLFVFLLKLICTLMLTRCCLMCYNVLMKGVAMSPEEILCIQRG